MYINDINILYYLGIGIIGLLVGQFIDWCNKRLPEYKKVFSKEFFTVYFKDAKPKYLLMVSNAVMYVGLLYFFGFPGNSELIAISYLQSFSAYLGSAPVRGKNTEKR